MVQPYGSAQSFFNKWKFLAKKPNSVKAGGAGFGTQKIYDEKNKDHS